MDQRHVADDPGTKIVLSHEPYLAEGQQCVLGVVPDVNDDAALYGVTNSTLSTQPERGVGQPSHFGNRHSARGAEEILGPPRR